MSISKSKKNSNRLFFHLTGTSRTPDSRTAVHVLMEEKRGKICLERRNLTESTTVIRCCGTPVLIQLSPHQKKCWASDPEEKTPKKCWASDPEEKLRKIKLSPHQKKCWASDPEEKFRKIKLSPHRKKMLGITDSMRSNFAMIREMSNRTRFDSGQCDASVETGPQSKNLTTPREHAVELKATQ
ncbi:hypothetical protein TNCV_973501 [Trichonephila clavipes]|nr:hypothetical protein TNCV_973501 [Trichonephila clavipes]